MNLHSLKPADGSVKKRKRIARGQGSGRGGTSTKGHKGAQSRTGYSRSVGFEGGQMPLQRRIPKFGFKNTTRVEYVGINLDRLQDFIDKTKAKEVTTSSWIEANVIKKQEIDIDALFDDSPEAAYHYNGGFNYKAILAWIISGYVAVGTVWPNILILGLDDFFANLGGGGGYAWIIGASLGAIVHLAISKR